MTRTEILEALDHDHQRLLTLLDGLDEQALTTPGVTGSWSVKDLLGHMAMWQGVAVQFVMDYRKDGLPRSLGLETDADIDAYNERGAAQRRDRAYPRVWTEFAENYETLSTAVRQLRDADLNAPLPAPWPGDTSLESLIAINSYRHDPEHIQQIAQWKQNYRPTGSNG